MDSLLKNGPHINKITSSCYCKLCNIAKIRPCLDTKSAQLIVQALVLSNIDYCNSLLAGSSQYQLNKLQHIQNMSCWVICNIRKHNHVSPEMKMSSLAENPREDYLQTVSLGVQVPKQPCTQICF